jgi:hypothetical protein
MAVCSSFAEIQNDSGFLQGQIAHSMSSSLPTSSASALLPLVGTPAANITHPEDCHDVQSSVVVACLMPDDSTEHRIS